MGERGTLEEAYRRTRYVVRLDAGELEMSIDVVDPAADERLRREAGCRRGWALVTPCNPRSQGLSGEENARRLEAMRQELTASGQRFVAAVHRDPSGAWPEEESFFLIDPAGDLALRLGRAYEQNAVVIGTLGGAPRLAWCDEVG